MILDRWYRVRRQNGEAGITLVELLVTVFLFGIVLAVAGSMFVSVARTTAQTQTVNEGTRIAANAMDEINRVIRFATHLPRSGCVNPNPAIREAKAESLALTTLVKGDDSSLIEMQPMRVELALQPDGNIVEKRWALRQVSGFWVDSSPTFKLERTLGGRFLATGVEESLFRYLDANGTELVPSSSGLTSSQRHVVAAVIVTMNTVPLAQPDSQPVVVENTIYMLNLGSIKEGCS